MTRWPLRFVDAFVGEGARGNGARVCVLDAPAAERAMQAVAREVGRAETAFLWPRADAWSLRWFTPTTDVPLCGHATLAAAEVLWSETLAPKGETLRFETTSGILTAAPTPQGSALDFPLG